MKFLFVKLSIIAMAMITYSNSNAQCTRPSAKSSTVAPTSFDYETKQDGNWNTSSTWKNGSKPATDPSGKKIKISHEVVVKNSDIILKSGSVLYVTDGVLTIEKGNLKLDDGNNEKFLAVESFIDVSGNIQQKSNTVFYCKDVELNCGDKGDASGSPLFANGSSTTSADFQNDGGYRRLEDVCLTVTHDYDNIGEDELINVCAEIGIRNPLNSSNPTGQGSGNISNSSSSTSMKVYGSQFFVPNGNVQNSKTMVTCDSKFKLLNGNFTNQSSSTWSGDSLCIWVTGASNHNLENSGTWTVSVRKHCINGSITGSYSTSLPSEDCTNISDCFEDDCCSSTPVPVSWLNVDVVSLNHNTNLLTWSTAQEIENSHFTIERSVGNLEYKEIGTELGQGTVSRVTDYEFYDNIINTEAVYYRVKQTDFNGDFDYSKSVVINPSTSLREISISPNPATETIHIYLDNIRSKNANIKIIDLKGSVLYEESVESEKSSVELDLNGFNEGIYIITVDVEGLIIKRDRLILKR
jgi:Secretion system C-terminal sorting domain